MPSPIVDVFGSGAICLGSKIVCDGFMEGYPFRVQTHVHDDHMSEFNKSKGFQDIFMSPETHDLLIAEYDADIEFRDNLRRVERNIEHTFDDGSKLSLVPSDHMLGSRQVALELPDGFRIGYSGDFGWPLDKVIQVDELVVDSTYGNPESVRRYTQAEAEECLLGIVCERLRHGPVHIKTHRGTVERVLHILWGDIGVPILATERLIREVKVYQTYGFAIGTLLSFNSEAGQAAMKERAYVRLYSKGDGFGNEPTGGTSITCSAYMTNIDHPLITYSEQAYSVALSNHADFDGTLAYIEATGAKKVVTDNTRSHGWDLANAINERFAGVEAKPSSNRTGPRWQ